MTILFLADRVSSKPVGKRDSRACHAPALDVTIRPVHRKKRVTKQVAREPPFARDHAPGMRSEPVSSSLAYIQYRNHAANIDPVGSRPGLSPPLRTPSANLPQDQAGRSKTPYRRNPTRQNVSPENADESSGASEPLGSTGPLGIIPAQRAGLRGPASPSRASKAITPVSSVERMRSDDPAARREAMGQRKRLIELPARENPWHEQLQRIRSTSTLALSAPGKECLNSGPTSREHTPPICRTLRPNSIRFDWDSGGASGSWL